MKFLIPFLFTTACWIILLFDLDFNDFSINAYPNFPYQNEVHQFQPIDSDYSVAKQQVLAARQQAKLNQISSDSLASLFTLLFTLKIVPHWLSTPWSFEGHTSVPREGTIACGYFVSTTLRDIGFNLDRYKFAQQLPVYEAMTLSLGQPLIEITEPILAKRIDSLRTTLKEGIYFIGFDRNHVGYLHKKGEDLFLIHSNFFDARGVEIERVENSEVFSWYDHIYIAPISTNRLLMQKWLSNERITVITNQ